MSYISYWYLRLLHQKTLLHLICSRSRKCAVSISNIQNTAIRERITKERGCRLFEEKYCKRGREKKNFKPQKLFYATQELQQKADWE